MKLQQLLVINKLDERKQQQIFEKLLKTLKIDCGGCDGSNLDPSSAS